MEYKHGIRLQYSGAGSMECHAPGCASSPRYRCGDCGVATLCGKECQTRIHSLGHEKHCRHLARQVRGGVNVAGLSRKYGAWLAAGEGGKTWSEEVHAGRKARLVADWEYEANQMADKRRAAGWSEDEISRMEDEERRAKFPPPAPWYEWFNPYAYLY